MNIKYLIWRPPFRLETLTEMSLFVFSVQTWTAKFPPFPFPFPISLVLRLHNIPHWGWRSHIIPVTPVGWDSRAVFTQQQKHCGPDRIKWILWKFAQYFISGCLMSSKTQTQSLSFQLAALFPRGFEISIIFFSFFPTRLMRKCIQWYSVEAWTQPTGQ